MVKFGTPTRPVSVIPLHIMGLFILLFILQIIWSSQRIAPHVEVNDLPPAPELSLARFFGLGDDIFLSKAITLWLQAHDYQPGVSLSFHEIDYDRLVEWLDLVLELDGNAQYPLLLAGRVYGEVNDSGKQRKMLAFIKKKFIQKPNERWRWMAHAIYIAKHRLKDNKLALRLARILSDNVTSDGVPFWARQMHIYILEDMGEIEAARVLLGGLIESGEIEDANEIKFLKKRLKDLEKRSQ